MINIFESDIQKQIIKWADFNYKEVGRYLMHIPNGGFRNAKEAKNLKTQGVRPGVPDLFLAKPSKQYHGMWIEVKRKGGKLSNCQKEWLILLEKQGYYTCVIYSLDEAIDKIVKYLT